MTRDSQRARAAKLQRQSVSLPQDKVHRLIVWAQARRGGLAVDEHSDPGLCIG